MSGHTSKSHKDKRTAQADNRDAFHHPTEKIFQLNKYVSLIKGDILEIFAGGGNLTKYYKKYGKVTAMTKEEFGDSFDEVYRLRADRKKFNVIDIDSYGYPDLFFPVVFEMMKKESLLIFTFPMVGVNCLNEMMEQHFVTFWRSMRPSIGDVTGILTDMALRNWYVVSLIDIMKIKRIWRFMFYCKRISAPEMCNSKNQPDKK